MIKQKKQAIGSFYQRNARKFTERLWELLMRLPPQFYSKPPKSILDVVRCSLFVRYLTATAPYVHEEMEDFVITEFNLRGLVPHIIYFTIYIVCSIRGLLSNQSILQQIYSPKISHYGDDVDIMLSIPFAIYLLFKIPLARKKDHRFLRDIAQIDLEIRQLKNSVGVDYERLSLIIIMIGIVMAIVVFVHMVTLVTIIIILDLRFPIDFLYEIAFLNVVSSIVTAQYCVYLLILKERFILVNDQFRVVKLGHFEASVKSFGEAEREMYTKIRKCAIIYSYLHRATARMNDLFGFMMVLSVFLCAVHIVVYAYYCLEAHIYEIYKSPQYPYFLICVFWEVFYSLGIILVNTHFCNALVYEAKMSAHLVQMITSKYISPHLTDVALQLGQQLLHEAPMFVSGLYKLEYIILLQMTFVLFVLSAEILFMQRNF